MFRFFKGKWVGEDELGEFKGAKLDLLIERSKKDSAYRVFLKKEIELLNIIEEKEKTIQELKLELLEMGRMGSIEREFLKLFLDRLDQVEEEDRTLTKCLKAIEAIRLSAEGLSADEEGLYKRAIKMALLQGKIKA
jgi:hypothetical protein